VSNTSYVLDLCTMKPMSLSTATVAAEPAILEEVRGGIR
jgi:hypothetical protein